MQKTLGRGLGLLSSLLILGACNSMAAKSQPAAAPSEKSNMFVCWANKDLSTLPDFKASIQKYLASEKQHIDVLVGLTDQAKVPKDVPKLFSVVYSDSPLEQKCSEIFGAGFSGASTVKDRYEDFRFQATSERPEDMIDNGSKFNPTDNTVFIVLQRKPNVPQSDFLPHVTRHVVGFSQLMAAHTLDGYVVWPTQDYVLTFIKFEDAKQRDAGLKTAPMKHFFEDQNAMFDRLQRNTMADKNSIMKFSNH